MTQSSSAKKKAGTKGMLSGNGRRTRSLSQPGTGLASGASDSRRDGEFTYSGRNAEGQQKDIRYNVFNAIIATAMQRRQKKRFAPCAHSSSQPPRRIGRDGIRSKPERV